VSFVCRNVLPLIVFGLLMSTLAGCSAHVGVQPTTGATVNQDNFEVVRSVSGTATHTKIFGFGTAGNMLKQARLDAVNNAGLVGTSRAIINWTSDFEYTFYGPVVTKRVVLSGEVVRFTD
jgi:hypothetical protein